MSTSALAVGLAWRGALQIDSAWLSALAVLPALAGMWLGQRLRSRISLDAFRRGFLLCLLLLGAEMSGRGFY
jgi:uncharacterized membrane protein YfcA